MKPLFRPILFLSVVILLALAACTPPEAPQEAAPEMAVIHLQITPALSHWLPAVSACAEDLPAVGVYTDIRPQPSLSLTEADVILTLDDQTPPETFSAVMGMEEIVIVTGSSLPLETLSLNSLQNIFTGAWRHWKDVPEIQETGTEINAPITIWSPPQGDEIRTFVEKKLLNEQPVSGQAQNFHTPEGLWQALANNPYGIAYGLKSHLEETALNTPVIQEIEPGSTQILVLALTQDEPEGHLKQLLLCLQNTE